MSQINCWRSLYFGPPHYAMHFLNPCLGLVNSYHYENYLRSYFQKKWDFGKVRNLLTNFWEGGNSLGPLQYIYLGWGYYPHLGANTRHPSGSAPRRARWPPWHILHTATPNTTIPQWVEEVVNGTIQRKPKKNSALLSAICRISQV